MKSWPLQEAKNRLGRVLDEAEAHGPQVITRHGEEVAVVLAMIAATARHHRLRIVTRNVDDFRHAGVEIVNTWK